MNWNPYLLSNIYLGDYVYAHYFSMTVVLTAMFLTVISVYMLMRSGSGYTVEDTQAHANIYGGVIYEGHGGMTVFLWTFFVFMIIWSIVYFFQHAAEFNIWFAY
ncbi:hypothetical protein Dform_01087 [Dehalogenimonas formicexedens]|uniref:Uncharacterized protein n=1 Tax=Dehalogenimonas formicexedens TaxID=1839801 RepID=A0A1P8F7R5_9CHLR|nr:hypothetical protein [Dehalogenimonas formicexedens]APV44422.1 hypothetical protein Dform_01087 [Dehalogenimonas formicexedens]